MVKVGGKSVPFFAADGKGANDLKRAMYGMKMKRAAYGAKMEMGMGGKMYEMMGGGMVKLLQEGGGVNGNGDGDPKKKSPYFRTEDVASVAYISNEGMRSAQSEGKIDAYNFDVPEGGLDAMSPEEQERLRNTPFGKKYLMGDGSLDAQYQRYSAKVNRFIDENPDKALAAANEMIDSGNNNFARAMDGKSDEEKLSLMRSYMTDKKVGDFHGAIKFDRMAVPTTRFYDPNPAVSQAGFRGASFPKVLNGVGDRMVRPGDISALAARAEEAGIDLSEDSERAVEFVGEFMDEFGSQERAEGYDGADNEYFMDRANDSFESGMMSRGEQAAERRRRAAEQIARQKGQMYGGGMVYKRADKGVKVDPTKEESERGVTSVSRGLFNRTENFGKRGTVKYPTGLAKLFTRKDLKAKF